MDDRMHQEEQPPLSSELREAMEMFLELADEALHTIRAEVDKDHSICTVNALLILAYNTSLLELGVAAEHPLMVSVLRARMQAQMQREDDEWDRRN